MSSLADLPELVGFFSYSREDDEDAGEALSALRDRIQRELRSQLGRSTRTFRLWQDKEAIPSGTLWKTEIKNAISQSAFFIPIITPTVVSSPHCRFELDAFLAREAALGRSDLVFPILYIRVAALEDSAQCQHDPVLSIIHQRQWLDWRALRHRDVSSTEVKEAIERFCAHMCEALTRPFTAEEQAAAQRVEQAAAQRVEEERKREEAEAKRRKNEARQAAEAQARRVEEERRKHEAEAEQRRISQAEAKWRAEGCIKVEARNVHGAPDGWFKPGAEKVEWFKDHEDGPEMVAVPAGEFMMGSPESEPERNNDEAPLHKVKIARPFAVGRHAVTRGQFAAFVNNTNYKIEGATFEPKKSWRDAGFRQDDNHPVVCVSWDDTRAYAAWLSQLTGQRYRLLSEAEWEYVARAGTMTPFWWGSSITPTQANYDGNDVYAGGGAKGEYRQATVPVGTFEPNPWGLYNVHGNVWEWCEDIWHDSYNGAPVDGSAWLQGGETSRRILRGGSWPDSPQSLRSAYRGGFGLRSEVRDRSFGFRIGRTLSAIAGAITVAPSAH